MWEVRQGLRENKTKCWCSERCAFHMPKVRDAWPDHRLWHQLSCGESWICLQSGAKWSRQPSAAWGMWAVQAWLLKGDSEWTEQMKSGCWVWWWFRGASELWTQKKCHLLNYSHCRLTISLSHMTAFVLVQSWMWHISRLWLTSAQSGVSALHPAWDSIPLSPSLPHLSQNATVISASRVTTWLHPYPRHKGLFLRRQRGWGELMTS